MATPTYDGRQELELERSFPVRWQTLAELGTLATTSVVVAFGALPVVVLVGVVVIRPLAAIFGALWEGARDEVVDFGADTAAALLNWLRHRLGIPRRR